MIKEFIGHCVSLNGDSINDMKDDSVEIDYDEILQNVGHDELQDKFPDYDWHGGPDLKMKDDFCVGYFRSMYEGIPVYYVAWSGIEFVWEM